MMLSLALCALLLSAAPDENPPPPNVIWITIDDCGPDFGCYGNPVVHTPRLDRLAELGQRFDRCFVTTPVCSPVRSALITGNYATTIGQHQHRSSRPLPPGYRPIPELLREAGYRVTFLPWQRAGVEEFLGDSPPEKGGFFSVTGRNKQDFNFNRDSSKPLFDKWDPEREMEPFFALIDFNGPKSAGFKKAHQHAERTGTLIDPAKLELPPYWPDAPLVREKYAKHLEGIGLLDAEVGRVFDWLDERELRERTLVFIWGDHGRCFLRHKQWCYDTGLRVPLIAVGPGVEPRARGELVSSIDLAATTLVACSVPVPEVMEGRDFLFGTAEPRTHVFASRDRCDETEDRVRAVRTERLKLIHNYRPELSWVGRNDYTRSAFPSVKILLERKERGELTEIQASFLADTKPEWELYDLKRDSLELQNRIDDPELSGELAELRELLDAWVEQTDTNNPFPEELDTIVPEKARQQVIEQRG